MTNQPSLLPLDAVIDCSPSGKNSNRVRVASARADGRGVCAPSEFYVVEFDVRGARQFLYVTAKTPALAKSAVLRRVAKRWPSLVAVAQFVSVERESSRNARYMAQFATKSPS